MEGLKGKVIVFAGAGGIATATARHLGAGGAKVVVGDVLLASAELAARTCGDAGGEGVATVADISDEEQVKNLIELALSSYGRIDGLFNVAANLSPEEVARDTTVVDIELDAWQRNLAVNLTGYLLTCKHAIPRIIEAGGGASSTRYPRPSTAAWRPTSPTRRPRPASARSPGTSRARTASSGSAPTASRPASC
jgi:NAD(P)-dependent dehydrogenase (short-subunit alcohol dehydrogenase family)